MKKITMTNECIREQLIKFFNNNMFSPLSAIEHIEALEKNSVQSQQLRECIMEFRTLVNDFETFQDELIRSVMNVRGYEKINTILYIKLYSILISHYIEKELMQYDDEIVVRFDAFELDKKKSKIAILMDRENQYYDTTEGKAILMSVFDIVSNLGLAETEKPYSISLGKYLGNEIMVEIYFLPK